MSTSLAFDERALLEAARDGDENAYRRLVEPALFESFGVPDSVAA